MADFFRDGPCRLRPHFKAHKTPEIARRQLSAGSCSGLTCATVSEAEVAADLCDDLLIANEPIGPGKCERIAALARRVRMTVAVDSEAGLDAIGVAARNAGVTVGVLVDLNVGQMRCGVEPGHDVVQLARRAASVDGVALRGLMGYEGHVVSLPDRAEREVRTRASMAGLVESAAMLRASGLPCELVSAGGTGTYDISGRIAGITEIQAGSYVLMDTDYGQLDVPFEQAFWVLGTVISRPEPSAPRGGLRSQVDDQGPWPPESAGSRRSHGGLAQRRARDPSCSARLADCRSATTSSCGRRTRIRRSTCTTSFYALEGDRVVDVWPIVARGYPELTHLLHCQKCHKCDVSIHLCRASEALGVGAY